MVKIEWSDEAKQAFRTHLRNAKLEFGESTAKRWLKERKEIEISTTVLCYLGKNA
jgi:hypothetical protein